MIAQQLFLDVQEFGRQAKQVRCGATEGPGVGGLGVAVLGRGLGLEGWGAGWGAATCACALARLHALSHICCVYFVPLQAGVDASQLESYRQLWRMVAPEPEQADTIVF
jgi:hypothetical protein